LNEAEKLLSKNIRSSTTNAVTANEWLMVAILQKIAFPSKQIKIAAWSRDNETLSLILPGTDVMILNIFSPKNFARKLVFFIQNEAKLWKKLIITLVIEEMPFFFCRKL
jgi:hypothetical protein